jgi:hypothetical protein
MGNEWTLVATLLSISFGVGLLAGILGRNRWSTVVIQTPAQPQPQGSSAGIALALLFIIVAWLYIAAALG